MDLNKVMIIGRLTRDPELRSTPSGVNVCQLSVATSYAYNNQQTGQKVEQTEFHNVVLWRKLADIAAQYLKKGTQVYLEGRLQTRSWDAQDGQKKYRTEIIADNMIMLGRAGGSGQSEHFDQSPSPTARGGNNAGGEVLTNDELPTIQTNDNLNVEDIPF